MAWDSYDDKYHLTRNGWVLGSNRPPDALESWDLSVRQPSGWRPADRFWTQTWVKPGIDPAMRAALTSPLPTTRRSKPPRIVTTPLALVIDQLRKVLRARQDAAGDRSD